MKNIGETLLQIVFIVFAFILIMLISLGISWDFTQIKTLEFWVKVGSQTALVTTVFNFVYALDKRNKTHDGQSRFYKAYATNRIKIKIIHQKKLYDDLDNAVEQENLNILIEKCNNKLHKICTRINYEEIIGDNPIEEIIKEKRISTKRKFLIFRSDAKRIEILIKKIRGGSIRVKKIKADIFLQDKELGCYEKAKSYDYNEISEAISRNTSKIISYLIMTIVLASIVFGSYSINFWSVFVTNITLCLSSMVSAFLSSSKTVKHKTSVYEHRNDFLLRYLDIKDEYEN